MNAPSFLRGSGDEGAVRPTVRVVGAGALVLGLVAALVPGLGDVVAGTLGVVVGNPVLVVLVAMGGGAYGLLQLYRTGSTDPAPNPLVDVAPERAHYDENAVSGDDIDKSVEAVGGQLPESSAKDWWTYRERNDVQSSLESVAVRVLASEHDVGREAATRLVESGEWTDDPRASAFLGTDTPDLPLKLQFVDWLSGEAYQRRVAATVDAVARHAGVGTPGNEGDASERTATGSALPVHAASESERLRAAAAELAPDAAASGDEDDATSMADVRLDAPGDDGGPSADDMEDADASASTADAAGSDADADGSAGAGDDATVELATERGGESR